MSRRRLYLGKDVDPATGALGARVELDPADLVTHGLIVGMTGSGKTGLAVALIEEVLQQGVPVLAIDPKGDLGNLLLVFPDLAPASFEPWVDEAAARREGKDRGAAAADAAAAWAKGLAEWGLSGADVAVLQQSRQAAIYTPGSSAGIPLNVLQSLDAPAVPFESAEEDLRDEIAALVSGLLTLVGIEADPLQSREHILLSQIVEDAWRGGRGLSLEALIPAVADPPFEKIGALPVESVFPRRERQALMMALNNLLASPRFEAWREGRPLDVESLLRTPDGKPRLSIVYTAHLEEAERQFVTALLLDKVKTWMRRQGGTSQLRALVYMDEIFGYFPPHPRNPPPKRPLLTLLKQARAQGVGVVLATQNPVDLDYKGLANIGTWMVGRLQTAQDRERLRDGLLGAGMKPAEVDALLDATRKRVFLLHDVHRGRPTLLHSRFALSYLRGPLTREEVGRLTTERPAPVPAAAPAAASPPVAPAPLGHHYLGRHGGQLADPYVFVKYAVKYKGAGEVVGVRAYPLAGSQASELLEAEPLVLTEAELAEAPPHGVRYSDLPAFLATPAGVKAVEKALKDRLADKLEATVWYDPVTEQHARPGEDVEAFGKRLLSASPGPDEARLREKLEKKKRDLAAAERSLSGRKQETWMAVGSALLRNLPGLLGGRRRSLNLSGAGGVLTKNRMENEAEARVEELRAEVAELDKRVTALMMVDASRFEERTLSPARGDVKVLRYDLVWVY
jgi:hypothetical protein